MPKAFDETEKLAIRGALKSAGLKHFERTGVRAARVDEICRDVGIAKGSFYAFYPSKEELFMAIVEEREELHRGDMYAAISAAKGSQQARAGGFFDLLLRKIEGDPVLNLVLNNNEIPHLVRKLGADRFAEGQKQDVAFAEQAARLWSEAGGKAVRPADLLGMMTIALSVASQRSQMTDAQYGPAVALLRELFVSRLTGTLK